MFDKFKDECGVFGVLNHHDAANLADIFTAERLARLPGVTAIGHVRYSTAGGSLLCNAQPIVASTNKGPVAIAHNGNFVNGNELRQKLEAEGAIFNTMADSEVIVHLIARSKA
ncbi:MAG: amidophosphoribosyltransferase, partial [Pyrinomonadaceae bacterium]